MNGGSNSSGRPDLSSTSRLGLLLNGAIFLAWLASLVGLLGVDLTVLPKPLLLPCLLAAVVGRTILTTGLFIVGHDAMHGVLLPEQRGWNDRLGSVALALYASLPYRQCRFNHELHHCFTASEQDPDFHGDAAAGIFGWYLRFMSGYLTANQMARLLSGWGLLALAACWLSPLGWLNVLLFCTLPLLLSSLQLFVFGTFLPHRSQRAPGHQPRAQSLDLPGWLSLLACYHFGYHREHHERPELAWFELPRQRRRSLGLAPA